jgi:hypothetical protein
VSPTQGLARCRRAIALTVDACCSTTIKSETTFPPKADRGQPDEVASKTAHAKGELMLSTCCCPSLRGPVRRLCQRLPPAAARSWVHGTWHKAVIGLPGSAAASMTGIEGAEVIQRGGPKVAPPTCDQMSAARRAELTLSTHSGISTAGIRRRGAAIQLSMSGFHRIGWNFRKNDFSPARSTYQRGQEVARELPAKHGAFDAAVAGCGDAQPNAQKAKSFDAPRSDVARRRSVPPELGLVSAPVRVLIRSQPPPHPPLGTRTALTSRREQPRFPA